MRTSPDGGGHGKCGSTASAISQPEKEIRRQRPIVMFVDEFWTLPALQSLLQIPALGRGQWVQLWLVGQSLGQIGTKYKASGGQQVVDTLESAMSYKVIFTQNDLGTAKKISESIGNRTVKQESVSRGRFSLETMFAKNGQGGGNVNQSKQSQPLFRPDQIMSMEKLDPVKNLWGWHLVQMTGRMNRPIECRPVAWFQHPVLRKRGGLPVRGGA